MTQLVKPPLEPHQQTAVVSVALPSSITVGCFFAIGQVCFFILLKIPIIVLLIVQRVSAVVQIFVPSIPLDEI